MSTRTATERERTIERANAVADRLGKARVPELTDDYDAFAEAVAQLPWGRAAEHAAGIRSHTHPTDDYCERMAPGYDGTPEGVRAELLRNVRYVCRSVQGDYASALFIWDAAANERAAREATLSRPRRELTEAEAAAWTVTEMDEEPSGRFGSLRRFTVCRTGGTPHTVAFELSHSGAPQHETCDCRGYKYRGECQHIDAVWHRAEFPCTVD